jgi:cell fate regulator YaaT (PSP1 superfamily)
VFLTTARYGANGNQEPVVTDLEDLRLQDAVVLKTERGTEYGVISSIPQPLATGVTWTGNARVLRKATAEDEEKRRELEGPTRAHSEQVCVSLIEQQQLPMQLVCAEHLLGNEKVYFYFLSETRVDFRNLVRELARVFQTRIELRQIGQREAARLVGDLQSCGQPLCCRAFLRKLEPIPMAMARLQKQSLDPSKISGLCGKLKCCLRFEDAVYNELREKLPERGKWVAAGEKCGRVVSGDVYNQRVTVETAEGSYATLPVAELKLLTPEEVQAAQATLAAARTPASGERGGEREGDRGERRPRDDEKGPRGGPPSGAHPRPNGKSGPHPRPRRPSGRERPSRPEPTERRAADEGARARGWLAWLLRLPSARPSGMVKPLLATQAGALGCVGCGGCRACARCGRQPS